ncbi:hypothetical protein L0B53_00670 [Vibrio sp. SS-MA-C1-2]|uniref:hypothetical protein n=1 Tax=Vibrio sp. SS-MA-C1-2 TaxID=2908646 RepID=UPI001F3CFBC7|nr:hypothetical protein [Vibrio sp. SS-MA-C1-2]UJF17324.1 hypothetical protein L0B53_00670 [Vibrio sp. SS-MA-C1-2]
MNAAQKSTYQEFYQLCNDIINELKVEDSETLDDLEIDLNTILNQIALNNNSDFYTQLMQDIDDQDDADLITQFLFDQAPVTTVPTTGIDATTLYIPILLAEPTAPLNLSQGDCNQLIEIFSQHGLSDQQSQFSINPQLLTLAQVSTNPLVHRINAVNRINADGTIIFNTAITSEELTELFFLEMVVTSPNFIDLAMSWFDDNWQLKDHADAAMNGLGERLTDAFPSIQLEYIGDPEPIIDAITNALKLTAVSEVELFIANNQTNISDLLITIESNEYTSVILSTNINTNNSDKLIINIPLFSANCNNLVIEEILAFIQHTSSQLNFSITIE